MSTDFELFPGKNLSGLFEDIYNNQINKKKHISDVIYEMRKMVSHKGDMGILGPIIKDLIDTSVRNDDQLVKLATIAQRIKPISLAVFSAIILDGLIGSTESLLLHDTIESKVKVKPRIIDVFKFIFL